MMQEYRWIQRYSRRYIKEILWYLFIGILGTVMGLVGSVLSKTIIDAVTGVDSGGIVMALTFYVLMQLFRILVQAVSSRIGTKINIRVGQEITAEVFDKILRTDWEALSPYHSGELISRLNGDVGTASGAVLSLMPDLITRLLQFFGTLGVILYYDPTLAIFALISAPVTLLMSRYAIRMMRHHNKRMRSLAGEMMVFNEETLSNLQLLKAFDRTRFYSEKHRGMQNQYREASLDYNRFSIRKSAVMSLVATVTVMVCFLWSVYRLWTGHITYGTMTLFLQLSGGLSASFSALAGMIPGFISATTAAGRIMAITQLPDENTEDCDRAEDFFRRYQDKDIDLVAKDVTYYYEEGYDVFSHTEFEVKSGELVAFVGPSGQGKTTLLRLILGIVAPKTGSISLCSRGEQIHISPCTRPFFSYVPQGNTLFSGTIRENLQMVRKDASEEEMLEALSCACADDFVGALPEGLDAKIRENGGGFSEGQLQRICIARAILSKAPFLLLDEATSALDKEMEKRLLDNLRRFKGRRTVLVTTHRPGVLQMSDRIYRINGVKLCPIDLDKY
ncbi:MAG: ABC transporter ATP-binding protein [Clostridia bacterium]|nr:ABC transporter ATP-binding protein [Clostridia bacterium]